MNKIVKKTAKKLTSFRPRIRSRHPSHSPFRTELPKMPFKSVIRFGSVTEVDDVDIEINSIEGVQNSSDKLLMKTCFDEAGVKTANWTDAKEDINSLEFPIIVKHRQGSRGTGNYLFNTKEEFNKWQEGKSLSSYIFEKYYTYSKEYRLHVTEDGCFYTCRKMLKEDTPKEKRFQRHDDNCVWILESNTSFDKPTSWDLIVTDCVKALKSLKLDVACFDIKVQTNNTKEGKKRECPEWIIIESGSAPSMGNITLEKYLEQLPILLTKKYNNK